MLPFGSGRTWCPLLEPACLPSLLTVREAAVTGGGDNPHPKGDHVWRVVPEGGAGLTRQVPGTAMLAGSADIRPCDATLR